MDLPIVFRDYDSKIDFGYILKTMSNDIKKTSPASLIPNGIFFPYYRDKITALIAKCNIEMLCIDDDPNIIVGYIIYQMYGDNQIIVHYANVKGIYRRMGIFNKMLAVINPTGRTVIFSNNFFLLKQYLKKYSAIFDPTIMENI